MNRPAELSPSHENIANPRVSTPSRFSECCSAVPQDGPLEATEKGVPAGDTEAQYSQKNERKTGKRGNS